jgi:hypothetical protein
MSVDFIRDNTKVIIKLSLINYIKDIKFRDSLFNFKNKSELISSIYIKFFINYTELFKALL